MELIKRIINLFFPQSKHPAYAGEGMHLRWKLAWLRTQVCIKPKTHFKFFLGLGPKVTFGNRVACFSSVRFVGPGKVHIADDCLFDSKPDLYTHHPKAVISIGKCTYVNGTRFGCAEKIEVNGYCILADARLMDTDFHAIAKNRILPTAQVEVSPIKIEENVWIAAGAAILKGVHVGENSVIAFGSVVTKSVSANKIYAGNPSREIGDIPNDKVSEISNDSF